MASESEGWHTPQWTWSYPGFLDQHLPHPQAPLTRRVPARWKASYSLPKRWRGLSGTREPPSQEWKSMAKNERGLGITDNLKIVSRALCG